MSVPFQTLILVSDTLLVFRLKPLVTVVGGCLQQGGRGVRSWMTGWLGCLLCSESVPGPQFVQGRLLPLLSVLVLHLGHFL